MKTNFFKRFMMPLAVMIFGFGLAFTTTSMKDAKVLLDKTAYRFISTEDPCHATKTCRIEVNPICKVGSIQLWGKVNETDMQCPVTLYERP